MAWISLDNLTRFYIKLKEKMYLKTEIDSQLTNKSDILHNHDDRYYTKSEIDDNLYGEPITNVTISGTAEVGKTLTATVVPSSVQDLCSYQWYRASASNKAGTAISGATSSTYTLTSSDKTYYIYCVASIGNANRQSNYTSAVKEITVTDVLVSGTAEVGQTLTVTASPSSVQDLCSYQWYRATANGGEGTPISGATSRTYTIADTDRTNYIYCVASIGSASVKSNYTSNIVGWHSWSHTISGTTVDITYVREYFISYTVPSNVRVTSISCTSGIRNHAPDAGNATAYPCIRLNGSNIATGSKFGGGGFKDYEGSVSWSGNITSGTISGGGVQYNPTGWYMWARMTMSGQILD